MDRVRGWIKRNADTNVVTYSRFGLPGDEQDDRPVPTKIHVAEFDDNSEEFRVFRTHSTRAALVSAGIGMSSTIFIFFSMLFEFQWNAHDRGFNVGALLTLFLLLAAGLASHWQIARGIRLGNPENLVPSIMIYTFLIFIEVIVFCVNQFVTISTAYNLKRSEFVLLMVMFIVTISVQSAMLLTITKARNYLELKKLHEMEMKVAEHSKTGNTGLEIVFVKKGERLDLDSNNSRDEFTSYPQSRVILAANDQIA